MLRHAADFLLAGRFAIIRCLPRFGAGNRLAIAEAKLSYKATDPKAPCLLSQLQNYERGRVMLSSVGLEPTGTTCARPIVIEPIALTKSHRGTRMVKAMHIYSFGKPARTV